MTKNTTINPISDFKEQENKIKTILKLKETYICKLISGELFGDEEYLNFVIKYIINY